MYFINKACSTAGVRRKGSVLVRIEKLGEIYPGCRRPVHVEIYKPELSRNIYRYIVMKICA